MSWLDDMRDQLVAQQAAKTKDAIAANPAMANELGSVVGLDPNQLHPYGLSPGQAGFTNSNGMLTGALAPSQFSYGNFSPAATAERDKLQGYIDQTRGQAAPELQRTTYNYAGIDPGLVAQSADALGRSQQAGLSQGMLGQRLANDQTGAGQAALVGRLNSDLNGGQPSLAAQQLAQGQAANNRQALSMAAGARGGAGNQVAALRAAMNAGAAGNQTLNAQQGELRAKEYAQARGELGGVLGQQRGQALQATGQAADIYGQQRGQDIGTSQFTYGQGLSSGQFQAGQNQFDATLQANQAAQQAGLEAGQRSLAQSGTLGYGQQQAGVASQDMGARTQYGGLISNRDLAERGLALDTQKQSDANTWQAIGTAAATAAPIVAAVASDERSKKNVEPEFSYGALDLRGAPGFSYEYRDPNAPGAAPGRHFGPMAQDLERTGPAGASTVIEGPDGRKQVDTGRLALVNTAAISDLQRRLSDEDYKTNVEPANGGVVDPWASSAPAASKKPGSGFGAAIGQIGAGVARAAAPQRGGSDDHFRYARAATALSDRRAKHKIEPAFSYGGERSPFDFIGAP